MDGRSTTIFSFAGGSVPAIFFLVSFASMLEPSGCFLGSLVFFLLMVPPNQSPIACLLLGGASVLMAVMRSSDLGTSREVFFGGLTSTCSWLGVGVCGSPIGGLLLVGRRLLVKRLASVSGEVGACRGVHQFKSTTCY